MPRIRNSPVGSENPRRDHAKSTVLTGEGRINPEPPSRRDGSSALRPVGVVGEGTRLRRGQRLGQWIPVDPVEVDPDLAATDIFFVLKNTASFQAAVQ